MEKFELSEQTHELPDGRLLRRIRALQNIGSLTAGTYGGFVETSENLSQNGACWIWHDAKVFGNARVCDNARVHGCAEVSGNAIISDNALIFGRYTGPCLQVSDHVNVSGNAFIGDNAQLSGNVKVKDHAKVFGHVRIYDHAQISGHAMLYDNAKIWGRAVINGYAQVYKNAIVNDDVLITGFTRLAEVYHIYQTY
ncbi:hypothetical protein I7V27_12280 [Lelliottia amnigena]|uniref:Acetyltransferase n=1 Tax=Lelliottia amnigena TaxID=61646 RepID=A0AAP2AE80_LELAM|nr:MULTISPECIES: hypothetical protein [Enterobacteriaceae]MBL5899709.1 hypothetical protein [Lelliottia amnigena]MBL5935223.1 hypothetical protein [Lelliottia amnigena]NTZ39803.1 hypothetical protein [Enterobacter sp. JMULE2]